MKASRLNFFAAVIFLLGLAPTLHADERTCTTIATLERTAGVVKVVPEGAVMPLRKLADQQALCAGDQVFTLKNAQAKLVFAAGELVMAENSQMKVSSENDLSLQEGTGLFEVKKREQGLALEAHTPLVVIGVKGTRFLLSSSREMNNVALVRGLIDVTRVDKQAMAHYRSKPAREMDFSEYLQQQQQQMQSYQNQMLQDFSEYKAQLELEFEAFKESVELTPGQQLLISASADKPEAIERPMEEITEQLAKQLGQWLP